MAQPRKQEKDFTAEVAALVPEVEGLAKVGQERYREGGKELMNAGWQVDRCRGEDHRYGEADPKCECWLLLQSDPSGWKPS